MEACGREGRRTYDDRKLQRGRQQGAADKAGHNKNNDIIQRTVLREMRPVMRPHILCLKQLQHLFSGVSTPPANQRAKDIVK